MHLNVEVPPHSTDCISSHLFFMVVCKVNLNDLEDSSHYCKLLQPEEDVSHKSEGCPC